MIQLLVPHQIPVPPPPIRDPYRDACVFSFSQESAYFWAICFRKSFQRKEVFFNQSPELCTVLMREKSKLI